MEAQNTPDTNLTPGVTSDESGGSKDSTPKEQLTQGHSSSDDTDADAANMAYQEPGLDRNPEAPAELLDRADLISADNIGDTVFSKHWLFTTLMRLIQAVDPAGESTESTVTEAGVDLGESLQDELCKLWDMSMNGEVVKFLQEYKAVDLFTGVVAKSKAPRATEICIGIFGNMACNDEASKEMAGNSKLQDLVLLLLADPDTPTLVETMRLLLTVISNPTYGPAWISAIERKDSVLGDIMFILSSSTNNDLLRNTAMFVDKLLDVDEELCAAWALPQFVTALLEAVKQSGIHSGDALDAFLHIFQLLSTTEMGVNSLVTNADEVCHYLLMYLVKVCADVIVIVEGYENAIASSLSTLNVIVMSSPEHAKYVLKGFELVRCVLKILDVVFPKVHPAKSNRRHHKCRTRSERRTTSESSQSPTHNNNTADLLSRTESVTVHQDSSACDDGVEKTSAGTLNPSNGKSCETVKIAAGHGAATTEPKKDPEVEDDRTRTHMLYEVLHGFARDMVHILNAQEALDDTPEVLSYLDTQAPRDRIYSLVWTLQDPNKDIGNHPEESSEGHNKVKTLQHVSEIYHLERLHRIIDDALSV